MFKHLSLSPILMVSSIVVLLVVVLLVIVLGVQFTAEEKMTYSHQEQALSKPPEAAPYSDIDHESVEANKLEQIKARSLQSKSTQQFSDPNSEDTNSFSNLDDESLLNISDLLENSLVPVFLANGNAGEKAAALDVFISRLPEGLNESDFKAINTLLRDYLPYDLADELTKAAHEKYRSHEQQQAYLVATLPDNTFPKTMAEQIAIARHLESLQVANEINDDTQADLEPSHELTDWKKMEEKLQEIASSPNASEQAIHQVIADEYDSNIADDYIELSVSEKQWQERYAAFLVEKIIIIESGLSAEDKAEQVETLIKEHYQENEWAAARGYDEMMQAQPES